MVEQIVRIRVSPAAGPPAIHGKTRLNLPLTSESQTTGPFLLAAGYAGEILAWPEIGTAWDSPSALARMTVGAVAGHLYLALRAVDKHLDETPEPSSGDSATGDPETGAKPGVSPARNAATAPPHQQWPRIERPEDLDRPDSLRVRVDGDHVAAWGWEAVRSAYTNRMEKLEGRLRGSLPSTVRFGAAVMDFGDYLVTRIVELLVHADDLAASVGLPPPGPPPDSVSLAIEVLTEGARSIYGDLEVLRAFTRPERSRRPIPSVY